MYRLLWCGLLFGVLLLLGFKSLRGCRESPLNTPKTVSRIPSRVCPDCCVRLAANHPAVLASPPSDNSCSCARSRYLLRRHYGWDYLLHISSQQCAIARGRVHALRIDGYRETKYGDKQENTLGSVAVTEEAQAQSRDSCMRA